VIGARLDHESDADIAKLLEVVERRRCRGAGKDFIVRCRILQSDHKSMY
jgi:hypothetical protein